MKAVSGKHFCKVLQARGWVLKRISGSHHIYARPENPAILTVPVHGNRDLKLGLLQNLMKHAGLSEEDL